MAGLEDMFGKLLNEEMLKGLAEGLKDGLKEGSGCSGSEETWCHVNGDKPVKNWIVLRDTGHSTCEFSKRVSHWKKRLAPFLKALPEGQGVLFLPATLYLEVTPEVGGE